LTTVDCAEEAQAEAQTRTSTRTPLPAGSCLHLGQDEHKDEPRQTGARFARVASIIGFIVAATTSQVEKGARC